MVNAMLQEAVAQRVWDVGSLASRIAVAAVIVIGALMLNRMVRHGLQHRHAFLELPPFGQALLLNLLATLTVLLVGTLILALWGVTWSTIATGIGLSTLAIALGLQDVLKSLAGGIVIMVERPFEMGDRIRIKDLEGEVIDMRVRNIVLRTANGHTAQAPNGLLLSESFENLSRTEAYSYAIVLSGIDDPPARVREAIVGALQEIREFAHTPEIVIQRELHPPGPWPLIPHDDPRHLAAETARKVHTRRAVVSWQSDNEDVSVDSVVKCLAGRYPAAQIEIRKR